jgi:cobalt/nickel transport protein
MKRLLTAAALAVLVFGPLAMSGQFKGTDDLASQAIEGARPGFKPWMRPIWHPPSAEVESLLFALQAAVGAGVLGYVIGRRHGAQKSQNRTDAQS